MHASGGEQANVDSEPAAAARIPSQDEPEMDPSDERTAHEHPPSDADEGDIVGVPPEPAEEPASTEDRN
jgi:hypothetical protein